MRAGPLHPTNLSLCDSTVMVAVYGDVRKVTLRTTHETVQLKKQCNKNLELETFTEETLPLRRL